MKWNYVEASRFETKLNWWSKIEGHIFSRMFNEKPSTNMIEKLVIFQSNRDIGWHFEIDV